MFPHLSFRKKIVFGQLFILLCCSALLLLFTMETTRRSLREQMRESAEEVIRTLAQQDSLQAMLTLLQSERFVNITQISLFNERGDLLFDAYTSPLKIEVDYGYVQTISTNFIIQKPIKY